MIIIDVPESKIDENNLEVQNLLKIWSEIEDNKETIEKNRKLIEEENRSSEDFEKNKEKIQNSAIPVMVVNACSKKATGLYFRKDYI